ncbi:hypothetical protein HYU11_03885 [Candidatus Woesearchaeota archaeon]|nr:hypothetical protein [Candidatus Woesearchaeota archaeon]
MKQSVRIGNPESSVAICTLWTPLDIVCRDVPEKNYAVIGQLYSKDAGLNTVLRYCLGNKKVRFIIVCGVDRTQSGQALINLKHMGVDDERNVKGVHGARIDREIPFDAIERFRSNVEIIDLRDVRNYKELNKAISDFPIKGSYGDAEYFPEAKVEVPENFPTDPVFKIRSATVGEAWLQSLQMVMKFGTLKDSEHGQRQKEILCMVVDITGENPDDIKWKPYFTFNREELEEYYPIVLSDASLGDVSYTYGHRFRGHKGIDQISRMAERILNAEHTRRAVAFTWDVELDVDSKNPPCLNLVQALVQKNRLYLIAYLRSNDIFGAWPKNAFALRKLQKNLCRDTGKDLGDLIMISASAHIYESSFRQSQEILREYPLAGNIEFDLQRSTGNFDPRGNIRVEVAGNKIKIIHLNPDGVRLEEFTASSAEEASRWLILEQKVSDISHALYIGQELMKAEHAIRKGFTYEQDST